GEKCEHQSVRPNDFQIFAHILDSFAVASPCDVKPSSGARVDLDTDALFRAKQPFSCRLGVGPGIEDVLRRCAVPAWYASFDRLLGIHAIVLRVGPNPRPKPTGN